MTMEVPDPMASFNKTVSSSALVNTADRRARADSGTSSPKVSLGMAHGDVSSVVAVAGSSDVLLLLAADGAGNLVAGA